MRFSLDYLSFYVLRNEGEEGNAFKNFKHYQTLDEGDYEESPIKPFLHAEFARIAKRKVEMHPVSDQAPTKVATFIVEPGHELSSNPNFNVFRRLRQADCVDDFKAASDEMVRSYVETSSIRGGAMIIARVLLEDMVSDPFVFVIKCDFEQQIARVSDEQNLISQVEMAISSRNMKSIQYPHMPEDGMLEEWQLKVHQASHARYFEEFLKFVTYEQSLPELINAKIMDDVQEYMEHKYPDQHNDERQREEQDLELWAASDKRDLQEKWEPQQVMETAERLIAMKPNLELKVRLGHTQIHALLADYGVHLHLAQLGDRQVIVIEGDSFTFDQKGFSPVELLQPESFEQLSQRLVAKSKEEVEAEAYV